VVQERATPRTDTHARTHAYVIYMVNFVFLNVIYLQNSLTDGEYLYYVDETRRRRNYSWKTESNLNTMKVYICHAVLSFRYLL